MDKYAIKLLANAYDDLDCIYSYIKNQLYEPTVAEKLIKNIESTILSLENLPNRGSLRKIGYFCHENYRQILSGNFSIIYRVDEIYKQVIVVTIRYSRCMF